MNPNISLSISKNIKKYRKLNRMTQEELAGKLFLDTQYYAQLERGERNFTIEKIALACSVFNVGIEDIIELNTTYTGTNDTTSIISEISEQLAPLTQSQLLLVQKFIKDVVPYCK